MADGEGMVAVVRGLKDAGLSVTLVDSGRQYTLLPDPVTTHPCAPQASFSRHAASQYAVSADAPPRRESGVQATDGRYASTYRMTHCRVCPTSPPDLVTEFPPQRAQLCPGRENFVIGGAGSGEGYSPATRCSSFRGGMCWPDRGSVFTPKPSVQADSFSSSLRRYPNICQDRSSEIVERLISFTQAKHSTLKNQRSNTSPTRTVVDSDVLSADHPSRYNTNAKCARQYEPDVTLRSQRLEESPTRERARRASLDRDTLESWRRTTFCRTNDIRHLRDVSRKVRDGIRNLSNQPNIQPEKLNKPRERCDPNVTDKRAQLHSNTNSVNMEIQAAVRMVSREVVTTPVAVPSQRTIAVPLTPYPSQTELKPVAVSNQPSDIPDPIESCQPKTPATKRRKELLAEISTMELGDNKIKIYKGSKSQDEIRMSQNEILVVQDFGPCHSKCHHRKINRSNKLIKMARNFERLSKHDSKFYEYICNNITNDSKDLKCFRSYARIVNAEATTYRNSVDEDLAVILENWLDLIPLKLDTSFARRFDREVIFYEFLECLQYFACNSFESNRRYKLKSDILNRLDSLPIEIKGNRRVVLSRLVDILINKVKHIGCKKCSMNTNSSRREIKEFKRVCSSTLVGYAPTESELKIFIAAELILYLERTCLKMNRRKINDLEDNLVDSLVVFIDDMHFDNYKRVKKSIIKILGDYGFSEYQAKHFANLLITHLKDSFISDSPPIKVQSETFLVQPNIQNVGRSRKSIAQNAGVSKKNYNIDNVDDYTSDLCRQIDEWLSSLKLQILESTDSGFRRVIINDLAGDIIDRQKYLELNPTSRRHSDEVELEHLRYQIFKWISKLVGETNFVPEDHAPELMRRIRGLPNSRERNDNNPTYVKDLVKQSLIIGNSKSDINIKSNNTLQELEHYSNTDLQSKGENISLGATVSDSSRQFNVMTMLQEGTSKVASNKVPFENKVRCNRNSKAACSVDLDESSQRVRTVEELEAEYGQFLKNWVQQVPIKACCPEQEAAVERARMELQNSLWKIVSKLNCDPATYYNRFFYEDLLDDAIEDLLDALPQTPDMKSMRHLLKVEFIEKTVSTNDRIKEHEDASFKNKLVKNVITNLRTHGIIDSEREESIKQDEDRQIKKLVEEYLLYTRFKNDNKLISDVFKKKLTQEIGEFVEDLKKNHVKELGNVDTASYKAELMNALEKVPLPCERTIKEETDDVLLGIEVEQWYRDLPITPNEDCVVTYQKARELEVLALKIKEMKKNINADDSYTAIKNEVSKFLEKTPLIEGDNAKINFMADELVNRIKNMKNQVTNPNTKRVVFQAPDTYKDFDENVPFASSYIETPANLATANDLSNDRLMQASKSCCARLTTTGQVDDNKPRDTSFNKQSPMFIKEPSTYRSFAEEKPTSSTRHESPNQWQTLKDSQTHAPGQNVSSAQHYTVSNTSYGPQEYQQDRVPNSVQNKSTNLNCCPNTGYQREVSENNQTQVSFADKDPRTDSYQDQPPSTPFIPRGIRTSRGIMGTSQVAGPSGWMNESIQTSQVPYASICTDDHGGNVSNQSGLGENISYRETPEERGNQSCNKSTTGCQSLRNDKIEENENVGNENNTKRLSVTTHTSTGHIPDSGLPNACGQNIPPSTSPNKKRPKGSMSEKEGGKRRLSLDDTDDEDDEYRCRCTERYWKCRRWPKRLTSEDLDDYPPCLPVFIPYPCFL